MTPPFDPRLVRKYDGPGPRYTSYPTADRFDAAFRAEHYASALAARNARDAARPLSLYVHLPFCNTICYYCACNKIITRNRAHSVRYVGYVEREIEIVGSLIKGNPPVSQLHWGGGTPTFLAHEEMSALMRSLREQFRFASDTEVSIEVDPRKVQPATVAFLADLGFNRISIGIQDFDPAVQQAVNRVQSEAETRVVMEAARAHRFLSINVDLIYGLPRQTVKGFGTTLDKVIDAAPDRIALYSYAHLPHFFKTQRQIATDELPAADAKLAILALAIERLQQAGYAYIGMDHFAKPHDELAVAQGEGKLHRNFQGYSTRPDCDLLAFGISAIGKVGDTYVQNEKTLDAYYRALDANVLPTMRGIALTSDDLLRRNVIHQVMCHFHVDFETIESAHGIRFDRYFARELEALRPQADDGIVTITERSLDVTPIGRLLVRAVAMQFDGHLRDAREGTRYSRIV